MKHDPTRQHKPMYEELNEGGTGHTVPHKDLNATGSAMEQPVVHYSQLVGKVNAKSPVQVSQINGFKSHHGNLEAHPMTSDTFGKSHGNESQIPNTGPKTPHTSATGHPIITTRQKSKSHF